MTVKNPILEVKDLARISPPWASIVPERSPVVQWHNSRRGAKVSSKTNSTDSVYKDADGKISDGFTGRYSHTVASRDFAIAQILPNGDLRIVEQTLKGEKVGW